MQYLLIYLLTVLGSVVGETLLSLKMIRDIADAGYLIDKEKLSESLKKIKETSGVDLSLNNKIIKFIPIVNLLNILKIHIDYNNARETIITQFSVMGALKEMTNEEKSEYSKKPSALKAMKIDINRELKLKAPTTSILEIENGKIWFEKSERDYNILKATGSAEDMSRFTQVNLIEDYIKELMDEGLKAYGDSNILSEVVNDCDNYNQLEQRIKLQKLMQKVIKDFPELKEGFSISLEKNNSSVNVVIHKDENKKENQAEQSKLCETRNLDTTEISDEDVSQNNVKRKVRKL